MRNMSKRKVSDKQLKANRGNARNSTGPKTPPGKDRSKMNAKTHGLLCKELLISEEERPEFESLKRELRGDLKPTTMLLDVLFEDVVSRLWCVKLALRAQSGSVRQLLAVPAPGFPEDGAALLAANPSKQTPHQVRSLVKLLDE